MYNTCCVLRREQLTWVVPVPPILPAYFFQMLLQDRAYATARRTLPFSPSWIISAPGVHPLLQGVRGWQVMKMQLHLPKALGFEWKLDMWS